MNTMNMATTVRMVRFSIDGSMVFERDESYFMRTYGARMTDEEIEALRAGDSVSFYADDAENVLITAEVVS